jgi:hypothetical protein
MELQFNHLPNEVVQIAGLWGYNSCLVKLYVVVVVEPVVGYHDLLGCVSLICCWCSYTWVLRDWSLCPVYTWLHSEGHCLCPESSKETRDLLGWWADTFCVILCQHSANVTVCFPDTQREDHWGEFLFWCNGVPWWTYYMLYLFLGVIHSP